MPSHRPYDFYNKDYEKGLALYASGVLIMEKCADLLPDYFSFVKGIVDSQDLSLNISREMLQKDNQLKLIHNALEKKIKNELHAMLANDREKYEEFWKEFGRQIKFGAYSDYGMHAELLRDLLLFWSAKEQKMVTIQEYMDKMPAEQKYIYFAAGDSTDRLAKLPAAELVLDKGYDVLLPLAPKPPTGVGGHGSGVGGPGVHGRHPAVSFGSLQHVSRCHVRQRLRHHHHGRRHHLRP